MGDAIVRSLLNSLGSVTTAYKFLTADLRSPRGGTQQWVPGEWVEIAGEITPCENGIHLCRDARDMLEWVHETLWRVEYDGDVVVDDHKIVVRRARIVQRIDAWNETSARLFACDCADDALRLIENPDPRSVEAVAVTRRYAIGDATFDELAAARAAAWAAGWDTALYAAQAVSRYVAWHAAWDAARYAAWAAEGDAARDAQARRLAAMLGIEDGNDG